MTFVHFFALNVTKFVRLCLFFRFFVFMFPFKCMCICIYIYIYKINSDLLCTFLHWMLHNLFVYVCSLVFCTYIIAAVLYLSINVIKRSQSSFLLSEWGFTMFPISFFVLKLLLGKSDERGLKVLIRER